MYLYRVGTNIWACPLPYLGLAKTSRDVTGSTNLHLQDKPPLSHSADRCVEVACLLLFRDVRGALHWRGGSHLPTGVLDCLANFGKWFPCWATVTFDLTFGRCIPQRIL